MLYRLNPRLTVATAATSVVEAVLYPALLVVVAKLLQAIVKSSDSDSHELLIVTLGVLVLLQSSVTIVNETLQAILRAESSLQITTEVLDKLASIPFRLFEDQTFQGTYGLLIREVSIRSGMLVESLVSTIVAVVAFLGVAVTLFVLAPIFVIVFAVALALATVEIAMGRGQVDLQTTASPDLLRMEFLAQKDVDSAWQRDLRTYRSDVLRHEYARLGRSYVTRLRRLVRRFTTLRLAAAAGMALASAAAVWWVLHLVGTRALTAAEATILLPGIYLGLTQARQVAASVGGLVEGLGYAYQLETFHATDFGHDDRPPAACPPVSLVTTRVAFDEVSYCYPQRAAPALDNVSLVLEPGVTAIVGPNGAGKSTVVKLLCGLITPDAGAIRVTGATAAPPAVAVLFQEPAHLHLTVRQCVTMRAQTPPGDDPAVLLALEAAGMRKLVESLPQQLDTVLGAGFGGQRDLSGGEWQRIALARMLYHDAPLLVLDEPVASMDPDGEKRTFAMLRELAASRIVVFTTHRYDSLAPTDRVVMLIDGRVVENGSHADLLDRRSDYWDLVTSATVAPPRVGTDD